MPTLDLPFFDRFHGRCADPSAAAPWPPRGRHRAAPRWLAALLAALLPVVGASAGGAPERGAVRPDPLDARASVPRVEYRSALAGYRPGGELKLGGWREANDNVARIGGWRAYAREAQAVEPPAAAASSAASDGGKGRSGQP